MKKEYIEIGKITTTHGIKGEVKVLPSNDEIDNLNLNDVLFLDINNIKQKLTIKSIKHIKQFTILGFNEYSNINEVLDFKNHKLYIKFEDATPLREGQYYLDDLIGLNVIDENNNTIGVLNEIYETGANDVYEIRRENKSELLIPAIKDCILDINLEKNIMKVHLLEGLE